MNPNPGPGNAVRFSRLGAAVLLGLLGAASGARAQDWVSVEEDDAVKRLLKEAGEHEKARRWREALAAYRKALDPKYADQLCRDREDAASPLYTSVAEHITRAVAKYPPEGLETYRAEYGPQAEGLFDLYRRDRDPAHLEAIVSRYFFTALGDDAAHLLATRLFESGRIAEAIYYWERILQYYPSPGVPPALVASRLMAAYRVLGQPAPEDELAPRLAAADGVRAGWPPAAGPLLDALRGAPLAPVAARRPADRPVPPAAEASAAPRPLQWLAPPPGRSRFIPRDDMILRAWDPLALFDGGAPEPGADTQMGNFQRRLLESGQIQVTPFPYRAATYAGDGHDTVVVQNGHILVAFDAGNGRPLWDTRSLTPGRGEGRLSAPQAVFGCVVDGRRVYANTMGKPLATVRGPEGWMLGGPRTIVCYDVPTGKRVWDAQGDIHEPAPGAGGAAVRGKDVLRDGLLQFPSPPAVGGGRVYAAGLVRGNDREVYVCAFQAGTGALLWKRFLCSSPSANRGFPMDMVPTSPVVAEAGGVVYCLTNMGVLAALHGASGNVLWLVRYTSDYTSPEVLQGRRAGAAGARLLCPPAVSGTQLVAFPQDASKFYVYDLRTGARLSEHDASKYTQFVGVHPVGNPPRRTAIFVGDNVLFFELDAAEGSREPPRPPLSGTVVAQGAVSGGILYLPSRRGLIRFDLGTLKILDNPPRAWVDDADAGNLLLAGSTLLVTGVDRVNGYVDLDHYVAEQGVALRLTPPHPRGLMDYGTALFRNRRYEEAASVFERASALLSVGRPADDAEALEARNRLCLCVREQALALLARNEIRSLPRLRELLATARAHAPPGDMQAGLLLLTARALATLGKGDPANLAVAVETYQEMIASVPQAIVTEEGPAGGARGKEEAGTRRVRAALLAAEAIAELIRANGREAVYRGVEAAAGRALDAARGAGREAELAAVVARFPNSDAAWEAARLLAGRAAQAPAGAEAAAAVCEGYLAAAAPDPRRRVEVFLALADVWGAAGRRGDQERALDRARRLAQSPGVETVTDPAGGAARKAAEAVEARLAKLAAAPPPPPALRALDLRDKKSLVEASVAPPPGIAQRLCVVDPATGQDPFPLPPHQVLLARHSSVCLWDLDKKKDVWTAAYPKPWLGFDVLNDGSAGPKGSVFVYAGPEGEPARAAGLADGDLIVRVNGAATPPEDALRAVAAAGTGRSIALEVRRDQKSVALSINPGAWPAGRDPAVQVDDVAALPGGVLVVPWKDRVAAVAPGDASGAPRWQFPPEGADRVTIRGVRASRAHVFVHYAPGDAPDLPTNREVGQIRRQQRVRIMLSEVQPAQAAAAGAASRVACLDAATGGLVWERAYANAAADGLLDDLVHPEEDLLIRISTLTGPPTAQEMERLRLNPGAFAGRGDESGLQAQFLLEVLDGRTGLRAGPGAAWRSEVQLGGVALDRAKGLLYYFRNGNELYVYDLVARTDLKPLRTGQGFQRGTAALAAGFGRVALGNRAGVVEVWKDPAAGERGPLSFRIADLVRKGANDNPNIVIDPGTPNALAFEGPDVLCVYSADPSGNGVVTAVDLAGEAPKVLWRTVATAHETSDNGRGTGTAMLPATAHSLFKFNRARGDLFSFDKRRDGFQERITGLPRGLRRAAVEGERLLLETEQEVRVYRSGPPVAAPPR